MGPMGCIEHLKSVERTLGPEGFKELAGQIHSIKDDVFSCMEPQEIEHLATISGAHAAGLYLRQVQHSYPHNAMSGWSLKHQLEAIYALIACEVECPLGPFTVNFASDLEVQHVVAEFKEYPVLS